MDTTRWVKLHAGPRLSWHIAVPGWERVHPTRCGLRARDGAPTADDLPLGERSCETCLRLVARDAKGTR